MAAPTLAQDAFHVSLSTGRTVGSLTIDDSSLVGVDGLGVIYPVLSEGHWQGLIGQVPGDIDALSRRPGFPEGSAQTWVFSLLADEAGVLDGDVLSFAAGGGLEVLLSESAILAALGLPGGSLDVDAVDMSTPGRILLSLQGDLSGSLLGDIKDGDVLLYDEASSAVVLFATEDDFQAAFTNATGSTAAIGDVLGLCESAGELWFTVQSPSEHDGSVFSLDRGGVLVRDELTMGLDGGELSALALAPTNELPCFYFDQISAVPGDTIQLSVHGKPNTMYLALYSGNTGFIDFTRRPGWGAISMSPSDPWLLATLAIPGFLPFVITDAQGLHNVPFSLPTAALFGTGFGGEEGWSFQMLEVPGLRLSAPFRVLKN